MPYCTHCGAANVDDAQLCKDCGASIVRWNIEGLIKSAVFGIGLAVVLLVCIKGEAALMTEGVDFPLLLLFVVFGLLGMGAHMEFTRWGRKWRLLSRLRNYLIRRPP